ncbi:MAG: heme lyase CcmF/NrfE family subunit, partial [Deltaproteobacteria bacterium]|nr:heme lyase CcmF/NrfE family subunit [Deltaproteobacteria bacterium]
MYIFAHLLLPAAFLTAIFLAASAIIQLWQSKSTVLPYVEKGCLAIAVFMSASSMILLIALAGNDFSLTYVARYTDRLLPLFYRLTAFWAGQEGSWLF